ncbi:hypothetical protein LP7551_02474 [Roseibium album]|jgi:hypothetical protein|nr:hypothetical protein LP7551_02474 [Roseibium album]
MLAQNELSPYFAEIDRRADRALKGIREVRRSAKLYSLPREPKSAGVVTGLIVVFVTFLALFLD